MKSSQIIFLILRLWLIKLKKIFMKTLKTLALIISLVFLFLSCDKENSSDVQLLIAKYDSIGIMHNQRLDSMLVAIKKYKKYSKHISFEEATIICKKNNAAFIENYYPQYEYKDKALFLAQLPMSKLSMKSKSQSLESGNDTTSIIPENDTLLSELQLSFLKELDIVLNDRDSVISSLMQRIEKIEENAIEQLGENELPLILATFSVAKSTLKYWSENYNEWKNELQVDVQSVKSSLATPTPGNSRPSSPTDLDPTRKDNNPPAKNQVSWKSAGVSDVGGAVAGASALGFARFLGPIGWKAWAVGIAGSAVGSSAGDVLMQLIR